MRLKQRILTVCAIFVVMLSSGMVKVYATEGKFLFRTGKDTCVVEVCTPNIIKIDYRPYGIVSANTPVIDKTVWEGDANAKIEESVNQITILTDAYRAVIDKQPFVIKVYDHKGELLIRNGKPIQNNLMFHHEAGDNFYGLSGYNRDAYALGAAYPLSRNSGGIIEAQPQGGCGAPFIWSTSGYGVVLDTDGGNVSNVNGLLTFGGCSKNNYEYYILVGSPKSIIASAGMIAGMPQMFPKWNTGFGQLEWGIDEKEFKTHVEGYRSRKIPFDWFMLDFDWMGWGEDNYGELRWGKNFPSGASGDLKKWSDSIHVKMTAITKPRIIAKNADGSFTAQGKYANDHGYWYPDEEFFGDYVTKLPSKDLQFAIPECQQWWWNHLKEGSFDKGMVGYLNDECDDSNLGGLYSLGNLSNIFMQKSIYEGQRAVSNQRVWSINRTAYMGSQKYAYSIWSGDNYPTFADLRSQSTKMLTANNVLVPVWGFCMTAFWNTTPVTPNLYLRSMQLGLFSPLYFLHGICGQQKQPWFFGEHVIDQSRKIVNLRYQLIPYMYSYDRVKHETMLGISRALVIDYPNDKNVTEMTETFMFGDYILASPVMDSAKVTKTVYMPQGVWIDYFNGEQFTGGKSYTRKVDNVGFTDIPMYIKKGAIIPTQDIVQYIGEKPTNVIYLDIFPDIAETSFPLYDDDGQTYDYEKGIYFKQLISTKGDAEKVVIKLSKQEGVYKPAFKHYVAKVHYRDASGVKIGGKSLKRYNSYDLLMKGKADGYFTTTDVYGKATYVKCTVVSSSNQIEVFGQECMAH